MHLRFEIRTTMIKVTIFNTFKNLMIFFYFFFIVFYEVWLSCITLEFKYNEPRYNEHLA